ncbi:MAG: hypothetical protein KAW88_01620 [Candidatus Cloacimonetes bacterium]|nr:hypothetical protein [Candidatus Cloacimonadota bacterium]
MKKFLILLCMILILFGCDRFEHNFEPTDYDLGLEQFPIIFKNVLENLTQYNQNEIEYFYSGDYKNGDWNKNDMVNYITQFFTFGDNVTLQTDSILISPSNLMIKWNFYAENTNREILVDTTFIDYLIKRNDEYQFYGDQDGSQKALVELATSITCVNCPYIEEALHHLKEKYSSRLSYIEYHIYDDLDIGNGDFFSYYGLSALPSSIIQGTDIIVGGYPTSQDGLNAVIEPIFEETPLVLFNNLEVAISGEELNGSVVLDLDDSVPLEDLHLKFVLIENENTNYLNSAHEYPLNVVIAKGKLSISQSNFDEPVEFSLSGLPDLPDDITLVIWVQTLEDPYNSETCKVYNVTEKAIE